MTSAAPSASLIPSFSSYSAPSVSSSRILSIQSSVVYGYVGNKVSVFPLQLLGFDIDPIHTCQLSNHTGYPHWTGRRTQADELTELIQGLSHNGMLKEYRWLLTGYMSSVDLLTRLLQLVKGWREEGMLSTFLCDPVIGDHGKLYMPAAAVPLYAQLVGHADIVTPNQTEAELLTEREIRSIDDAVDACAVLHDKGPRAVIITSITLPSEQKEGEQRPSHIHIVASQSGHIGPSLSPSSSVPSRLIGAGCYYLRVPHIAGYWSGTGDLTSALLLGWLLKSGGDLQRSLSLAVTSVQAVMKRTAERGGSELQLVDSIKEILHPEQCEVQFHAEWRERSRGNIDGDGSG